jgi:hypothetical protein
MGTSDHAPYWTPSILANLLRSNSPVRSKECLLDGFVIGFSLVFASVALSSCMFPKGSAVSLSYTLAHS